jgi:hypothetical protein
MSGVRLSKSLLAIVLSSLLVLSIIPLIHMASGQVSFFDFGDAPDGGATGYPGIFTQTGSFPSLLASDGARVQSTADATLGPTASMEADALVVNADADDGVSELIILTVSIPPPAKLSVTVNGQPGGSGGTFYVNVLIDLNLDGEWAGATVNGQPEWVVQNFATTVTPGESNVVPLPEFAFSNGNALPAGAWMRVALTKEQVTGTNWDGSGEFSSGEIEDHVISLPVVGGKTPAMPVIENCQPNPALFPPGGVMTMFTCDIYSPQPGFATVAFNCTPDTITVIDFGNIGPPYPVGPAAVTLNFIAFKGTSPPPRVTCNVVASSQDPPSIVTQTGVTIGFADSVTTVDFDTTEEEALPQTYVAISDPTFSYNGNDILWNTFYAGVPITMQYSLINTTPDPINMESIVQVLDEDGVAVHIASQNVTLLPGEDSHLDFVLGSENEVFAEFDVIYTKVYGRDMDSRDIVVDASDGAEVYLIAPPPTRPAEWWAERPALATPVWENVVKRGLHLECSDDFSIDSVEKLMGGLWADPATITDGESRGEMSEERMELARQFFAARLNQEAFGSAPDIFGLSTAQAAHSFCNDIDPWVFPQIRVMLEDFNSLGAGLTENDLNAAIEQSLPPQFFEAYDIPPDPELAQEMADLSYWNQIVDEEGQLEEEEQPEEEVEQPQEDEISFTHKVGDTDCPQLIGLFFLEGGDLEKGVWFVKDQPEWLDIEIEGDYVTVYFNCFIEDVSSHTIEGEVEFEFVIDQPPAEEVDDVEISVVGEIVGVEDQ